MDVMDAHHRSAMSLVFGGAAMEAFDISKEPLEIAERYGRNPWGQYTLMARRRVKAGVTFVTVDTPHWDHHSQLVEGHAPNMRAMDECVGALMTDLVDRGLLDQVMVIVMRRIRPHAAYQRRPGRYSEFLVAIAGRCVLCDACQQQPAAGCGESVLPVRKLNILSNVRSLRMTFWRRSIEPLKLIHDSLPGLFRTPGLAGG